MKVLRYIYTAALLAMTAVIHSCDMFRDVSDIGDIETFSISINTRSMVEGISPIDLTIQLVNAKEDINRSVPVTGATTVVDGLMPGTYHINIGGNVKSSVDGKTYYMNASQSNIAVVTNDIELTFNVTGAMASALVFKEIYWSCTKNAIGSGNYLVEQFYEIYNNSDATIYIDGLYLSALYPLATTATPPNWGTIDSENNVFGTWVFQIPGEGSDYPLEPGESCIIASMALDHKNLQNSNSPVNLGDAEFECYTGHALGNQPAPNMMLAYYTSNNVPAQFLATTNGPAVALFRVPEDVDWNPGNPESPYRVKPTTGNTFYAMISNDWLYDVVECGLDETKLVQKRIPAVLDAGMAYVGATYNGLGIRRKLTDVETPQGTPIYQDTNNSTNDFEMGVVPEPRYNNAKMPSWNWSLQGNSGNAEDDNQ